MKTALLCAVLILVNVSPARSAAQVSGPVLGFDFDSSAGVLRPIWGIPGAAWIGTPLDTGVLLSRVAVSPGQDYILGEVRDESRLVIITLRDGRPILRDLPGVRPGPIAISPNGGYAAVRSANSVQVIAGLPDAPTLVHEADTGEGVATMAVSDSGSVLVGAEGAVFLTTSEGVRFLMPAARPSAAVFVSRRDEALVADAAANTIYRVTASGVELLAAESDGIAEPVALGVTRDNRRAFVANAQTGSVAVIALDERSVSALSTAARVRSLDPLAGDAVFRLTPAADYPIWILEAGASSPRLWFIPPPAASPAAPETESAQ